MERRRLSGQYKIAMYKNIGNDTFKGVVRTVTGFMYQCGAYQYFTYWENYNKISVTESSTGFRAMSLDVEKGETPKTTHDRIVDKLKGFDPSLANWNSAKEMMKKYNIPYPLNEWIVGLKDINHE